MFLKKKKDFVSSLSRSTLISLGKFNFPKKCATVNFLLILKCYFFILLCSGAVVIYKNIMDKMYNG